MVASQGGAPRHPVWFFNVKADPQERAVAAYPPYAEYQRRTEREIPVFVLEPAARTPHRPRSGT